MYRSPCTPGVCACVCVYVVESSWTLSLQQNVYKIEVQTTHTLCEYTVNTYYYDSCLKQSAHTGNTFIRQPYCQEYVQIIIPFQLASPVNGSQ